MELVTTINKRPQQPSFFGPAKAAADRAMRENATLRQQILRANSAREAALRDVSVKEAALAATAADLAAANKIVASLRQKVTDLTAEVAKLSAANANAKKKIKKEKPDEAEASTADSAIA